MTTRDVYLHLLDREPDIDVIKLHGCTRRLSKEVLGALVHNILASDEFEALKKCETPRAATVASVRTLYKEKTGHVDGGGVLHYARLVDTGTVTLDGVRDALSSPRDKLWHAFCHKPLYWPIHKRQAQHHKPKTLCHLFSPYKPAPGNDTGRIAAAIDTWNANYSETFYPCPVESNDPPGIVWLIDSCIKKYLLPPTSVIVYTNADIMLCDKFEHELRGSASLEEPCFSFRRDFSTPPVSLNRDEIMNNGKWFSGTDLFVIPVKWWLVWKDTMPNMKIGRPYWDMILRHIIGVSVYSDKCAVSTKVGKLCDIPGLNAHVEHPDVGFLHQIESMEQAIDYLRINKVDPTFMI